MFHHRFDAAQQLISQPQQYRDIDTRILSIPTGGVPMASLKVHQFRLSVDIAFTKHMGYPLHKELARGCVIHMHSPHTDTYDDVPQPCIDGETNQIRKDLKRKYKLYKGDLEENNGQGKPVIWIDDEIPMESTMVAMIQLVRQHNSSGIIVVVLFSSQFAQELPQKEITEYISLLIPFYFKTVASFMRSMNR